MDNIDKHTASAVNRIIECFHDKARFDAIDAYEIVVGIEPRKYRVTRSIDGEYEVFELLATHCRQTNFSEWVENVLNGLVRNEAGKMVKKGDRV